MLDYTMSHRWKPVEMPPVDMDVNKQKSLEKRKKKYPNLNNRQVVNLDEFGNPVKTDGTITPRFPLKNILHK